MIHVQSFEPTAPFSNIPNHVYFNFVLIMAMQCMCSCPACIGKNI